MFPPRRRGRMWMIQLNRDGTTDVLRGGRRVQNELPQEAAVRYIRRRWDTEDRVIQEDLDGARRDITRRVRPV